MRLYSASLPHEFLVSTCLLGVALPVTAPHVALDVEWPMLCLAAIPVEVALAELGLRELLELPQLALEPPHWAGGSQNEAGLHSRAAQRL